MSVIERKIAMMQQEESAKCAEEPLGLNDSSEPEGYRLIDVSCIKVLMSALLCSECVGSSLERTESGKGIHFEFVVLCTTCGEVARALHSVNIGDTRLNELAARIDLSARDSGVSFTKLSHLFTGINLPPPMCLKTAKKVAAKVHDAAVTAAGKVMRSAAQSVRKAKIVAKDELLDVCVTFDGTWNKRGHTSHFGGRCGAGLESLKKVKGLGGKGKLTNIKIKKPTNYYACALKDNAPDVTAMQRKVYASLLHSYSTDEEPRHSACPTGMDSWHHFNRSKDLKEAGESPASWPPKPAFS
ncbi:hypothetical protein HPB47_017817 [Ixodes persulcatus]|uniref:Uncharacterized protein n=1 Tax=Ixodes persulcatus TaxID=34615 RepID=A0AC60QME3_IXOPE|nr:hypothetical protein HPB47_017817 [Ixodes persulcatus]